MFEALNQIKKMKNILTSGVNWSMRQLKAYPQLSGKEKEE
jgi:hypothetical protein